MIKGINYYSKQAGTGTPIDNTVTISAVDPNKVAVILQGMGVFSVGSNQWIPVWPYIKAVYSSSVIFRFSMELSDQNPEIGCCVIEYI